MMWLYKTRPRILAGVLGALAFLAWPACSQAQDVVNAPPPSELPAQHRLPRAHGLFHARREPVPRTYSYLYDTWFNQPRHFRVVGEDGQVRWRTTVHGLPRGTPWTGR